MPRLLNSLGYTGFAYFRKCGMILNMRWDAIKEGYGIFHDPEYIKFQHIQALHKVLNMAE